MDNVSQGCTMKCWIAAAILGLVVFLFGLAGKGVLAAVILGVITTALLGFLFTWMFCTVVPRTGARKTDGDAVESAAHAAGAATGAAAAATVGAAQSAAAKTAEVAEAAKDKAASAVDSAAETVKEAASDAADAGGDAAEDAKDAAEDVAEAAEDTASEAADAASDAAGAAKAAAPVGEDYDADGVVEGNDEGSKPETLSAARDSGADNLKEIKGVGPKLEQMLNEMGFFHFDQIANWTADEVAWVNANLKRFKGRVSRDNWVEQAKILASGGDTEFSKRVEDGDVY
ncbi:endonuclease [Primorskyibacter aestuariivivens]|uniref:endonuclease n=1 Tax=Primorskyibacter aestuariivivens TaxID=1888912 RepID=UPI0023006587|nr:endonuclease [Primorskyibacter aestuariivivens]MDA7428727.1 endonuclease [Primorskyibacter aestuariivivens]